MMLNLLIAAALAPQKGGRYLRPGSGDEVWTNFPVRVEDIATGAFAWYREEL